ncbi:MAG: Ig-like domain-containing protein [Anaerolineae bacterium]
MFFVFLGRTLSRQRLRQFVLALGLAVALVACGGLDPTAIGPGAEPTDAPTEVQATPTPSAAPPTATPAPPADPLPPVVVEHYPLPGEELPGGLPLSWRFSEPMDRLSVVSSLRFLPPLDGDLTWRDGQTLIFEPSELNPGTRYEVTIGMGAASRAGLPMSRPFSYSFVAMSPLEVTRVTPRAGKEDVRIDVPILLEFNRPVVPADCAGQAAVAGGVCVELPLTFEPQVIGGGHWVNPALYRFDVLTGLSAGQVYDVTLGDGVISVDGASMSEPFAWSFVTARPQVVEVEPSPDTRGVALDAAVSVRFSTPMDQATTGSGFTLTSEEGQTVAGTITWRDNGAQLVFTATERLMLGTVYHVRLGARARAATSAPLEGAVAWAFETVSYPELVSYAPTAGANGVSVMEPLRLTFEGAIDEASLAEGVKLSPQPDAEDVFGYYDTQGNSYYLSWERVARTEYCVEVLEDVVDVYGNPLAEAEQFCFETGDLLPLFEPVEADDGAVLVASRPLDVRFLARNAGSVSFALRRLSIADWMQQRIWDGELIREWSLRTAGAPNSTEVVTVTLEPSPGVISLGLYSLSWEAAGDPRHSGGIPLAVVDRHVMVKRAVDEALAWVTEIADSRPISRTAVQLVDQEALLVSGGTTDDDGLVRLPLSERDSPWYQAAVVGEPGTPGFGVALTTWQPASFPDCRVCVEEGPEPPYRAYVTMDRPVYRPGETMRVAGWLRTDGSGQYGLPEPGTGLTLSVREIDGTAHFTTTAEINGSGRFEASFVLPVGIPLGDHVLEVATPWPERDGVAVVTSSGFTVVADRESRYAVTVGAKARDLVVGETARFVVDVLHDTAGPRSGVAVDWAVYATPTSGLNEIASGDGSPEGGDGWALVMRGQGTTDAFGRLIIRVPAELIPAVDGAAPDTQEWMLIATAVDEDGSPAAAMDHVHVHRAEVALTLTPEAAIVRARERVELRLKAVDWRAKGVPGQEVTVRLIRQTLQQAGQTGAWEIADEEIAEQVVTTADGGVISVAFSVPRSGSYLVRAETVDAAGRLTYAQTSFAAGGDGTSAWPYDENALVLVSDADRYRVGETARILIPVEIEGPYQVLLTVEQSTVLWAKRYVFDQPNPVVEIPIDAGYGPDFYVSCIVVAPSDGVDRPDVRVGYRALTVDAPEQVLDVEIRPDADTYEPGEDATLVIRTVDAEGQPVDAEVALMLVEASYPACEPGAQSAIHEAFYRRRPLRVLTGDGLFGLRETALTVSSSGSAMEMRPAQTVSETLVGGFCDPVDGGVFLGYIPDVAYWNPQLRTGPTGEATVTVTLPDSLKTWQAVVWAINDETAVGSARVLLTTETSLSIRPLTPPFLVAGDSLELSALVENHTSQALEVVASLTAEAGLAVTSSTHQHLLLPVGARRQIWWQVDVLDEGQDAARAVFAVEGGAHRDVSRLIDPRTAEDGIPLYRHATRDRPRIAGALAEASRRVEALVVPETAGAATALTVQIDPSLVDALSSRLALVEPPAYGGVEAWADYVLPAVAIAQALQEAGVDADTFDEATVVAALDQICARQNSDGGWGWWRPSSDVYLSSYVTYTLLRAQEAGLPVRRDAVEAALAFLDRSVAAGAATEPDAGSVFGFYVLSRVGRQWPQGVSATLYSDRARLGVAGRAYLALALGTVDPSDPRVATLLTEIEDASLVDAAGRHWQSVDRQAWATDVQVTALVLETLSHIPHEEASGSELVGSAEAVLEIVRWLMAASELDPGTRGYATAWALTALADAIAWDPAGPGGYAWELWINGSSVAEGDGSAVSPSVADGSVSRTLRLSGATDDLLHRGINALQIERGSGDGTLFYAARVAPAFSPEQMFERQSRGMSLVRYHCAVEAARPPGGQVDDLRDCVPVESVRVGDLVEVRLILAVPVTRHFVQVESGYPSGFELASPFAASSALETTASAEVEASDGAGGLRFHGVEAHEDRIQFFADELPAGVYEVAYTLRATVPGSFRALPGLAEERYFPEVWAQTESELISVVR